MTVCGPNLSICCSVLSAWGMLQLGLTGLFFYLGSPALVEDIPLLEKLLSSSKRVFRIYSTSVFDEASFCDNKMILLLHNYLFHVPFYSFSVLLLFFRARYSDGGSSEREGPGLL